jgi:hypothetical protein
MNSFAVSIARICAVPVMMVDPRVESPFGFLAPANSGCSLRYLQPLPVAVDEVTLARQAPSCGKAFGKRMTAFRSVIA